VRHENGTPVLIAPMMVTERPSRGPLRVRSLQFFGADPSVTELRGVLVDPAHEAAARRVLIDDLMADNDSFDWIEWCGILRGGVADMQLDGIGTVQWGRDVPNFILPLAGDWDEFRKGLRKNIRQSLRKCYNSLKAAGVSFEFEVVSTADELCPAIHHFFRLHRARSLMAGTVAHPDVFDSTTTREFFQEVAGRLAERGITRAFLLRIDGEVVAVRIGFVMGDSVYLYYSGYDPAWARFSVATTVLAETLKWAMREGLTTANLSTGSDVSKTRWGPREVRYRDGVQVTSTIRGQVAWNSWRLVRRAQEPNQPSGYLRTIFGRRRRL
jgi:CelD/BcsL family acetyltransferase involved in cellulose biosynthesis